MFPSTNSTHTTKFPGIKVWKFESFSNLYVEMLYADGDYI